MGFLIIAFCGFHFPFKDYFRGAENASLVRAWRAGRLRYKDILRWSPWSRHGGGSAILIYPHYQGITIKSGEMG